MGQTTFNLDEVTIIENQSEAGSTWTIEAPKPAPNPALSSGTAELIHEAGGGASKVWLLGGSTFCKSKRLLPGLTLEHVTLAYVKEHSPDFEIPHVHHHEVYNNRYYIITRPVNGITLEKAWPTMDEADKDFFMARVVEICTTMAEWVGHSLSGVDGNNLADLYLAFKDNDLRPQALLKNFEDMGVDCSELVFYHCDRGPGNILVDLEKRTIAIIDWESAGWVPKVWIRTKFRISSGMDLDYEEDNEKRIAFRRRVQLLLGERGFPEIASTWCAWNGLSP